MNTVQTYRSFICLLKIAVFLLQLHGIISLGQRCSFCFLDEAADNSKRKDSDASSALGVSIPKQSDKERRSVTGKPRSSFSDKLKKSSNSLKPFAIKDCSNVHSVDCLWAAKEGKDLKLIVDATEEMEVEEEEGATDRPMIMAHRSILCEASGVWAAMFGGQGWLEDTTSEVTVGGGVGINCVQAIVHYLYGCRRCSYLSNLPLIAYINLLHACHMYGLAKLQHFAAEQIVQNCVTGDDVLAVYVSGVGRINEDIITAVLIKLISVEVPTWRRSEWLQSLSCSVHGPDLLHNLYTIVFRALESGASNCNCDISQSLYMASESVYDKLI